MTSLDDQAKLNVLRDRLKNRVDVIIAERKAEKITEAERLNEIDMSNTTGTGWPESYSLHANVKLTAEQKAVIEQSGEPESQWIRGAVQDRIDKEAHYARANEAHRNNPGG